MDSNSTAILISHLPWLPAKPWWAPGTGGRGTLKGGSLELSNVDIATEFANLIVAQRGFEADAKAVTTFDQITQDTIALKQ